MINPLGVYEHAAAQRIPLPRTKIPPRNRRRTPRPGPTSSCAPTWPRLSCPALPKPWSSSSVGAAAGGWSVTGDPRTPAGCDFSQARPAAWPPVCDLPAYPLSHPGRLRSEPRPRHRRRGAERAGHLPVDADGHQVLLSGPPGTGTWSPGPWPRPAYRTYFPSFVDVRTARCHQAALEGR